MLTSNSNANNIARVQNSHLRTADAKLHSLVSLKTNKPIEGFPSTAKEVQKLTGMLIHFRLISSFED